jgi:nifR3 family TIM-barrel protein
MAGITDMPFRRLMKRMGAGCVISEFVSAHAVLIKNNPKTKRYLSYHEDERPVGIQLFGGDTQVLADAAKVIQDSGLDFVDINLGCPVPKVTKKGGGSAWLCHLPDLAEMLAAVRKAVTIPLTIKIRTGWDSDSINCDEILKIAHSEGVHWVAIHGRTRAQGYAGHADWALIDRCAKESPLPIIGNGDVITGPLGAARLFETSCAGIMIGRGALKNPWIFQESVEAWKQAKDLSDEERFDLARRTIEHHKLPTAGTVPEGRSYYDRKVKALQPKPVTFGADFVRIRADRDALALIQTHLGFLREVYPEPKVMLNFRKFIAWYAAGYPNAHQFRKFIFTTDDFSAVIERTLEFFDSVKKLGAAGDSIREEAPVLMSGHG